MIKNQKYVLFGPPASGKSSLIQLLPTLCRKIVAIDLELVVTQYRKTLISEIACHEFIGPLFIGAANLCLNDIPDCFQVVFLFPTSKEEYLEHVHKRNEQHPEKRDQYEAEVYDGMSRLPRERMRFVIDNLREANNIEELGRVVFERLELVCSSR